MTGQPDVPGTIKIVAIVDVLESISNLGDEVDILLKAQFVLRLELVLVFEHDSALFLAIV